MPKVDRYFAHPLLLWMPRKLWRVTLQCPQSECKKKGVNLTSGGLHKKVRRVIDVSMWYCVAAETLICPNCKRKVISWAPNIISQLDIGHQIQFPCILTAKLACDMKVIRLLRDRGLGNSSSQIQRKLSEEHGDAHIQRIIHYLTDCESFTKASTLGLVVRRTPDDIPPFVPVPGFRWLMQVYLQDVMARLGEIKGGITSIFGEVLKVIIILRSTILKMVKTFQQNRQREFFTGPWWRYGRFNPREDLLDLDQALVTFR